MRLQLLPKLAARGERGPQVLARLAPAGGTVELAGVIAVCVAIVLVNLVYTRR